MKEIWKIYKETRSNRWGKRIYEVSNLGNVKINGELYKPYLSQGYRYCAGFKIATAVASLFVQNPDPENKKIVDHIDTNRENDNVTNLRWCTVKENMNNPLTKKHISESEKGEKRIPLSKEHKQLLSNLLKGIKRSEETRQKMSEARKLYFQKLKQNTD